MHKFAKLHALSFKPRQTTRNKPIIIFIFEGVLGDFRDNQLFMREDSFTTLRELQTSF